MDWQHLKEVNPSLGVKCAHTHVYTHAHIHSGHELSWLEADHATVPSVAESVAGCG